MGTQWEATLKPNNYLTASLDKWAGSISSLPEPAWRLFFFWLN